MTKYDLPTATLPAASLITITTGALNIMAKGGNLGREGSNDDDYGR